MTACDLPLLPDTLFHSLEISRERGCCSFSHRQQMEPNSKSVRDFILEEVPDWDDEVVASARFKAFSGQRSDWEPRYLFWRDLIIKIARNLGILFVRPSQVKNDWFKRGGLTPLCIDHVLFLMYNEGDILRVTDIPEQGGTGRLTLLFRKVMNLVAKPTKGTELLSEDQVILTAFLKDKANEVINVLSQHHWNSFCVVTMSKFQQLCGGANEASAVLRYMSGCWKAQYLSVKRKDFVEGVKIALSTAPVSDVSNLDGDMLHLIWTMEMLQKQLDVIDGHYGILRKSALDSLHSGKRNVALRYARAMKLASDNRDKCSSLFNRVEEVLAIIANAESTQKVSEAIHVGAKAMRDFKINPDEIDLCLSGLQQSVDSLKQVEETIEQTPLYHDIEDEDIEDEFKKLEMEIGDEESELHLPSTGPVDVKASEDASERTELLNNTFSNLKISDGPVVRSATGPQGVNCCLVDKKSEEAELC